MPGRVQGIRIKDRSSLKASRPNASHALIQDGESVDGLISVVEALPLTSPPQTESGHQYVFAVGREEISFPPRLTTIPFQTDDPLVREDVCRNLTVKLVKPASTSPKSKSKSLESDAQPAAKGSWEFQIRPRQNSTQKVKGFKLVYRVDGELLTPGMCRAMRVVAAQPMPSIRPGIVWPNIIFSLGRYNGDPHAVVLKMTIHINWNPTPSPAHILADTMSGGQPAVRKDLIRHYSSGYELEGQQQDWSPQDFYEAVTIPDKESYDSQVAAMKVPGLRCTLFPFQRRGVQWMLGREGVRWVHRPEDRTGTVEPREHGGTTKLPMPFVEIRDCDNKRFFLSPELQVVTQDTSAYGHDIRGGILAEEMGLGKTVETISLILLHRQPEGGQKLVSYCGNTLHAIPTTLIIAPLTLLKQWLSEFKRHAPHLKVMEYLGIKDLEKQLKSKANEEMLSMIEEQDVVLTTYSVLRREFYHAASHKDREMRQEKRFGRTRSPLVQCLWWRVCIDEAQTVQDSMTAAGQFCSNIPRQNAWAITGTPVQSSVNDLRGLVTFLQIPGYAFSTKMWNRITTVDKTSFHQLFNAISMRHTKSLVRDEIEIPSQKRYVVTMPFSNVEQQNYRTLFEELVEACGLSTEGKPLKDSWAMEDPKTQKLMRKALDQLREAVLHPDMGHRIRRTLGLKGPVQTIDEVLDAMLEVTAATMRTERRTILTNLIKKGKVEVRDGNLEAARKWWEDARGETERLVSEYRNDLRGIESDLRDQKMEVDEDDRGEQDEEEAESPSGEARRRLRMALEIHHQATFLCGKVYSLMDPGESKEIERLEAENFDEAKKVRKELLQQSSRKAKHEMIRVIELNRGKKLPAIAQFVGEDLPAMDAFEEIRGALNGQATVLDTWRDQIIDQLLKPLVDEDDGTVTGEEYKDSLDVQSEVEVFVHMLRTAISDRRYAIQGQENNLVEHEIGVARYRAERAEGPAPPKFLELFNIRQAIRPIPIHADPRVLFASTAGEGDGNETDTAQGPEASENMDTEGPHDSKGKGPEAHQLRTGVPRHEKKAPRSSLHAIITAIKPAVSKTKAGVSHGTTSRGPSHERPWDFVQRQFTEQLDAVTAWEQEVEIFSRTLNARIAFYRCLQILSDQVADIDEETDGVISLESLKKEEATSRDKLEAARSRHEFLLTLRSEALICGICREESGSNESWVYLNRCMHLFHKECLDGWLKYRTSAKLDSFCPTCRRPRIHHDVRPFRPGQRDLRVDSESSSSQPGPDSTTTTTPTGKKSSIYAEFDAQELATIQHIRLHGARFTTKVDMMLRHLLFLRVSDPGAKSIIFSQYDEFLKILARAFKEHNIGYATLDNHVSKKHAKHGLDRFNEDPDVEVFLLCHRTHASGLNLVKASHVFLCEPLLNTALELQAIARVNRIGQRRETTVWMYVVDGTIEQSIYDLSVQRRLEHMRRHPEGGEVEEDAGEEEEMAELLDADLDAANALELERARPAKLMGTGVAGEVIKDTDLYPCLFGRAFDEDLGVPMEVD